jgi:hypothetical protein
VLIPWDRGGESYIALDGGWNESDFLKEGMILSIVESDKDYDGVIYREVNRETFYYSGAQITLAAIQPFAPEIKVYPNPASNTVYFSLGDETLSRTEIKIIDLSGKTMIIKTLDHEGSIDISSLNNGLYLIQIKTGEKVFTRKFIKSTY